MTVFNIILTIAGLAKDISFLLRDLTIEEWFCAPLYGQLILLSDQEIVFDQILNNRISIEVNDKRGHKRYFHGFVVECVFKRMQYTVGCNRYVYIFKFASFLHYLKNNTYFRIFAHKTIQETIECLLKPYLTGVNCEVHVQDKSLRNYIQYDVTDFYFLHQLLVKYHLFYFFKTAESIETLVIADDDAKWIKVISLNHDINGRKLFMHWQEKYAYNQPDSVSVTSHYAFLNIGSILKSKRPTFKQWKVKSITHRFRHLTVINNHSFLLSALYENKFYAIDTVGFKAREVISIVMPTFLGVEKTFVVGHQNTLLRTICPRTENKSSVAFIRSELRQNKHLVTSFMPQKGQVVLLSFEAGSLTEGIILGGLFKMNQAWPFDMDQEGISISSEEAQQALCFDKAGITLRSAGNLNQNAHHNLVVDVGNGEEIDTAHSMCYRCSQGGFCVNAQSILAQVGSSRIYLTQKGILMRGKKIFLN